MSETKYTVKRIETQLTVKLMNGKTVRDMLTNFFGGQIPDGIIKKGTNLMLGEFGVSDNLYKFIKDTCKDEEFIKLLNEEEFESVCTDVLQEEIYTKIPFDSKIEDGRESIHTGIKTYALSTTFDRTGEFKIYIETYTYQDSVTESDVKAWNKSHAKALRKYLVKLPSVQGVPYSCSYKDDVQVERSCEV